MQLVTVLETHDSVARMLAAVALNNADLAYIISSNEPAQLPSFNGGSRIGESPLWDSFFRIQVAPECASAACALIEVLHSE